MKNATPAKVTIYRNGDLALIAPNGKRGQELASGVLDGAATPCGHPAELTTLQTLHLDLYGWSLAGELPQTA